MSNKAKLAAYNTMKAPQHGSKDYDLLKHLASHHELVQKPYVHSDRLANGIFYALLDYATPDEIKQNRRAEKKTDFSVLSGEAGSRTAQLGKAESIEQADCLLAEITEIANQIPEGSAKKQILSFATAVHIKIIDELKEVAEALAKENAEKSLLVSNLAELDYQVKKALIKDLGIEPENFKAETLHAALVAYKAELELNSEKISKGSGEANQEVKELTEELETKDSENIELKDKVEDLEDENETLQEQVDELKSLPGPDKKKDSPKSENIQK